MEQNELGGPTLPKQFWDSVKSAVVGLMSWEGGLGAGQEGLCSPVSLSSLPPSPSPGLNAIMRKKQMKSRTDSASEQLMPITLPATWTWQNLFLFLKMDKFSFLLAKQKLRCLC